MTDHHNHDDDCELRLLTATNPMLVLMVTRKDDGELDVMFDGFLPEVLRPGALRAIADDLEAELRGNRSPLN